MGTSCTSGLMFKKKLIRFQVPLQRICCTAKVPGTFFFLLILMAACSSSGPDKNPKKIHIDKNMPQKILLFVPGYYGSSLKEEATGEIRWAKASNFLFSTAGVADSIPGTSIGSDIKLVVDDVLKNVPVIPGIWDVDAYKSTLEQLGDFASKNNMQLETAAYDWRDDSISILKVIDQKIKSFDLKPNDELYVVSHSMSASLLAYYLRYGAQDVETAKETWEGTKHIKKIALIAPPLHGLMILFRDMEDGTSIGLNRNLLSARDYSTFKSSYFFLPPKGEDIGIDEQGEKISLGIHDITKWEENRWGPFQFATDEEMPAVRAFVKKYMKRSEKFHELMRASVVIKPDIKIPLLHMRGLGHPTLEFARLKKEDNRLGYDFKKKDAVDGDGTVTAKSAGHLSFFKELDFTTIDNGLGHLDILAKPESQIFIQDFLRK
jgi:hypothetical protein